MTTEPTKPAPVLSADGAAYDRASLVEDADGLWTRMGGAMALVIPSPAFEARRKADNDKAVADKVLRDAAAAKEAAIQAELRAMAEERIAARRGPVV